MSETKQQEIDRLREALTQTMERLDDLAFIATRTPWNDYPLAGNFMRCSAKRIRSVLSGGRYSDDVHAAACNDARTSFHHRHRSSLQ